VSYEEALEERYRQQRRQVAIRRETEKRHAAEKAEKKAAQEADLSARLKRVADEKIAKFKQEARARYIGDPQSFEKDFPEILHQHQIAAAAGLLPPEKPVKPDIGF
jgi:hypothetical protein